jgi:hypothetical protein
MSSEGFFVLARRICALVVKDVFMVLIKVQYDAYNRQFKILDRELARTLQDGEIYMLIADVSITDLELKQSVEIPSELVPVTA